MTGRLGWLIGVVLAFGFIGPIGIAAWLAQSYPQTVSGASRDAGPPPLPESLLFDWHAEPRDLPSIEFADADGKPVALSDYRGRYVLINLWATWCAPCIREMPELDELKGHLEGPDFAVIVLNQDRAGMVEVEPFWQERNFAHLTIHLDKGLAAGRAIKPRGLPTTLLIDPQGRELARLEGIANWAEPEVMAFFQALVG